MIEYLSTISFLLLAIYLFNLSPFFLPIIVLTSISFIVFLDGALELNSFVLFNILIAAIPLAVYLTTALVSSIMEREDCAKVVTPLAGVGALAWVLSMVYSDRLPFDLCQKNHNLLMFSASLTFYFATWVTRILVVASSVAILCTLIVLLVEIPFSIIIRSTNSSIRISLPALRLILLLTIATLFVERILTFIVSNLI